MPPTRVLMFKEDEGSVPLLDWLEELPSGATIKCRARIDRLGEFGHELRRPMADVLRDDIHERRAKHLGVNYRLLYFFSGRETVVLSHGISKQQARVPDREIDIASDRRMRFFFDPFRHSHEESL